MHNFVNYHLYFTVIRVPANLDLITTIVLYRSETIGSVSYRACCRRRMAPSRAYVTSDVPLKALSAI